MSYTLEQLSADIRATLKTSTDVSSMRQVCQFVSKALRDKEFIERHLTAEQCRPRKVLYEDSELGFCVCGHVYENAADGFPHDHGPTWAVYGLAAGDTEMTDWGIVKNGMAKHPSWSNPRRPTF